MTDYTEEHAMEVEALESIYMDDFKRLTDDPLSFQIHIVPNQDGQNNFVALKLKCQIPATYPDVAPSIDLLLEKGLSDSQYKEIHKIVTEQVNENLGMAMIYTITEAVREYLVENNREGNDGSEYQEMMRRMDIRKKHDGEAAANEQKALDVNTTKKKVDLGTPVTLDTFLAWRAKFEAEMQALVRKEVVLKDAATAKLTGRMLWNQGLVKETPAEMLEGELEDEDDDSDYVEGEADDEEDE